MKKVTGAGFLVLHVLIGGCASPGSDVDSESHFQCSSDLDCAAVGEGYACIGGGCELEPGTSAGPLVSCDGEWPADAAFFETTAGLFLPNGAQGASVGALRLNRRGTVVVATAQKRLRNGDHLSYLIRWAGDTVAHLQEPAGGFVPSAVSCDGMAMGGSGQLMKPLGPNTQLVLDVAYHWKANDGFISLEAPLQRNDETHSRADAISEDGSTVLGMASGTGPQTPRRWINGAEEQPFEALEDSWPSPGWSGDGSVFVYSTREGTFRRSSDSPPTPFGPTPAGFRGTITGVSSDGRVLVGNRYTDDGPPGPAFVWRSGGEPEDFLDNAWVRAVTPSGVALASAAEEDDSGGQGGGHYTKAAYYVRDRAHGVRRFTDALADHGIAVPAGTTIWEVSDISADGRVIIGRCQLDDDSTHLFRAVFPAGAFE
jgi:uncharacterized membrane protein